VPSVKRAERELCFDAALLGGRAVPSHGLGRVFRHRQAVMVQITKVELGRGMPKLGQAVKLSVRRLIVATLEGSMAFPIVRLRGRDP
jgi:hypothetical protein